MLLYVFAGAFVWMVWVMLGFYVTDTVMGRDKFFQWVEACGPLGYVYATLWPVFLIKWWLS